MSHLSDVIMFASLVCSLYPEVRAGDRWKHIFPERDCIGYMEYQRADGTPIMSMGVMDYTWLVRECMHLLPGAHGDPYKCRDGRGWSTELRVRMFTSEGLEVGDFSAADASRIGHLVNWAYKYGDAWEPGLHPTYDPGQLEVTIAGVKISPWEDRSIVGGSKHTCTFKTEVQGEFVSDNPFQKSLEAAKGRSR